MTHRQIVVAGGGICGLATATALARTGHSVTVVERAGRLVDVGSGLVLAPNGVKAADAIDPVLGERIREGGSVATPERIRPLVTSDGTSITAEPVGLLGERHGAPQVSLLRTTLQQALVDSATAAGVELRTGVAVDGFTDDGERVTVTLGDGTTLVADLLVGADGLRSVVRARLRGDTPPRYSGYTSVRGRCPAGTEYPHGFLANGRGIQMFVAPVGPDRLYWAAKITADGADWPRRSPSRALGDLLTLLDGWDPALRRVVAEADVDDITVTDISDRDPDDMWVRGRVVLVGDAAHPTVPAMGQGANMALEDAVVLADALSPDAVGPAGDLAAALDRFVRARAPRTTSVVLASRRQGERDQGSNAVRAFLRNAVMRLRGRKDRGVQGLFDWTPPELRVRRAGPLVTADTVTDRGKTA